MKQLKNLLVQYKGGGYDGCFWEWNFFLFDSKGKFHNLMSTGRCGIKTKAEALEILNKTDIYSSPYTYKLTSKAALKEFSTETHNLLIKDISEAVNTIYKKPLITWDCDLCGDTCSSPDSEMHFNPDEYHFETKLCEDCLCSHTCGYCGAFEDEQDSLNVDDEGRCKWCTKESEEVGA